MTEVIIGDCRLIHADSYEWIKTNTPPRCMVTDPQYEFKASGGGRFRKDRPNMDDIQEAGLDKGFEQTIINPLLFDSVIVFCHNDQLHKLIPYLAGNYYRHVVLPWIKTNPLPVANKNYDPSIEFFIHAWNKGVHPVGTLAELKRYHLSTGSGPSHIHLTCDCETVKPDSWKINSQDQKNMKDGRSLLKDICEKESGKDKFCNISISGSNQTEKFQKECKSTISILTNETIDYQTCNLSHQQNTKDYIVDAKLGMEIGSSRAEFAINLKELIQKIGIYQKKDGHCTGVVVPVIYKSLCKQSVCERCGNPIKTTYHPTQKPIHLMNKIVRNANSDEIFDPFMGSGSTGLACIEQGKKFVGIEKNKKYFDIAVKRIEEFYKNALTKNNQ